jgi:hypothetical protein
MDFNGGRRLKDDDDLGSDGRTILDRKENRISVLKDPSNLLLRKTRGVSHHGLAIYMKKVS